LTGPEQAYVPPPPPPPPAWGYYYPPPYAWRPPQQNTVAVVGLALSISGVVLLVLSFGFAWLITFPLSIAGLVCGAIGKRKVDRGELVSGRGAALGALIVGIVGVVLHLIAAVLFVIFWASILDAIDNVDTTPGHDLQPALIGLIGRV
jgi:hypothetical protein